jgi:hypothetical protein
MLLAGTRGQAYWRLVRQNPLDAPPNGGCLKTSVDITTFSASHRNLSHPSRDVNARPTARLNATTLFDEIERLPSTPFATVATDGFAAAHSSKRTCCRRGQIHGMTDLRGRDTLAVSKPSAHAGMR